MYCLLALCQALFDAQDKRRERRYCCSCPGAVRYMYPYPYDTLHNCPLGKVQEAKRTYGMGTRSTLENQGSFRGEQTSVLRCEGGEGVELCRGTEWPVHNPDVGGRYVRESE